MTHLADKMKQLASGTQGFAAKLEAKIDQKLAEHQATQESILSGVDQAFSTVDAITQDAQDGLTSIQSALKDITNQ